MRFGIKENKEYFYEFNKNEELEIYSKIGKKESPYQNYSEWHNYVCKKYGGDKYTEYVLKNFMHYLKREKNINKSRKEMWSGCTMPLLTVFITIVYTFVFSVVNVINTYNNSINTLVDDEFLEYTGYNPKLIYSALEQNLYSGMWFYAFGAVVMILVVLWFLFFASDMIRTNNLKDEFYSDYIMILQEIVEERQTVNEETV